MIFDLRLGRWQDVLADVGEVDAAIFDAPYSSKVHEGNVLKGAYRDPLGYDCLAEGAVYEHVAHWSPRTRGWMVSITCTILAPVWAAAMEAAGRYVFWGFPPLLDKGMSVRLAGDGPSNWCCWLVVGRPKTREASQWGTLPGAYIRGPGDPRSERRGGKPLGVMRAIVRDYSRPGDLVLDTHAGGGTTLLAAILEGRRAIGAEVDPEAWRAAMDRCAPEVEKAGGKLGIETGRTLPLFG